jgi:hypothetical protein
MCIGADVAAYYETSNNLLSFPSDFPFKISRSQFETQKRPVSVGYTLGLISVQCVRPERDPKETHSRPKRDLFATSDK